MGDVMSKRVRAPLKTGTASKTGKTEPERQNRSRAVAELLPAVGGAAFRRFGFVQSAIVSRWPEIVGEKWAGASVPESIRFPPGQKSEGVLTLTVKGGGLTAGTPYVITFDLTNPATAPAAPAPSIATTAANNRNLLSMTCFIGKWRNK